MKIILEVGTDRVTKHGRHKYTFGDKHSVVVIDPALGRAIELLVAERDAAVKRVAELENSTK